MCMHLDAGHVIECSAQYTSWINNGKLAWTLLSGGLVADNKSEIAARPIPQEPMYIIFNLGMSRK